MTHYIDNFKENDRFINDNYKFLIDFIPKDVINPILDPNFDISGTDTASDGCNLHLFGEIEQHFVDKKIFIIYKKEESLIVFLLLIFRLWDGSFFSFTKVTIGDLILNKSDSIFDFSNDDDISLCKLLELFKRLFKKIYEEKLIIIECESEGDFNYAKGLLIHFKDSKSSFNYNFCKEIDRWGIF